MSSNYRPPPRNGYDYDDGYQRQDHRRGPAHAEVPNTPPAPYYPQTAVRYRSTESDTNRYRIEVEAKPPEPVAKPQLSHPVPVFRLVFDLLLLLVAWIPVILLNTINKPFQRGFYCDDLSIRYPYVNDTITPLTLYTVGAAIVFVTLLIVECVIAFTGQKGRQVSYSVRGKVVHPLLASLYIYLGTMLFTANVTDCGGGSARFSMAILKGFAGYCIIGFIMVQIATDICKNMVGRLRPHFIDACRPDWSRINCTGFRYVTEPFCQSTNEKVLTEARVSFLSGHASYSGYMMFYLVLYLQARWHWPRCSLLAKYFLQFAFAMLALFTGLSRISDYKHHWSDVLSGFALGILGACLTTIHIGKIFKREAHARLDTGHISESGHGYPIFGSRYNPSDGKSVY